MAVAFTTTTTRGAGASITTDMKTFRVVVSWNDSAVICIEAENADEAAKRARILVEDGRGHYPLDPLNAYHFCADDTQPLVNPDTDERDYMRENAEAWAEYEEENAEDEDDQQLPESITGDGSIAG